MKGISLFVLLGIGSSAYGALGDNPDAFLEKLQEELAKRGNPWIAGKTSVSHLSWEEKQKLVSGVEWIEGLSNGDPYVPLINKEKKKPPTSLDWRNKDGHNWMTSVKEQGTTNACWAFAWVGAQEARWRIVSNQPNAQIDLSEQFLVSCNPYGIDCIRGGDIKIGEFVKRYGIPDEACFRFLHLTKPQCQRPCDEKCSDWQTRAEPNKVTAWGAAGSGTSPISASTLKQWLMDGPVAGAIYATNDLKGNPIRREDFFYYKGGVYTPIMGRPINADHAVIFCGWTSQGYWIFKNSWGTDWGDNGYGIEDNSNWQEIPYWAAWMNPIPGDTSSPAIWTTPSLHFEFHQERVSYSPPSSLTLETKENAPSDEIMKFMLLPRESILKPSQLSLIGNPKPGEDTIKYDAADEGDSLWSTWGPLYWGVRFTPLQDCKVIAGLIGRYNLGIPRIDTLIVRADASGTPGTVIERVAYTAPVNQELNWLRQDLSTPYSVSAGNDFWLTYYVETDSAESRRSLFVCDNAGGERSYFYDGEQWRNMAESGWDNDWLIRAIVTYEGGFAGSGTIWVKNTGGGKFTVSNVYKVNNSNWISSINPTSFDVWARDSVGVIVVVDTTGLQVGVTYYDTIVVESDIGTKRVPVTLIIHPQGVEEEDIEEIASMFKIFANPVKDKVAISYFLTKKSHVRITIHDIAGREIAEIVNKYENGLRKVEWDIKNTASGVYFCRIETPDYTTAKKFVIVR
jgi:hypothetical protein